MLAATRQPLDNDDECKMRFSSIVSEVIKRILWNRMLIYLQSKV